MKKSIAILMIACLMASVVFAGGGKEGSISSSVYAFDGTAHYDVKNMSAAPIIDGVLEDDWNDIGVIEGAFHFPWTAKVAPKTIFRAYKDAEIFYFSFVVYDEDIVYDENWSGESTVDNEDRVELFFAQADARIDQPGDTGMPTYYAIEVDPLGRVHDYGMVYYRHIDSSWNMEGLETAAKMEEGMYTVEGSIPIATFKDLGLMSDDGRIRIGVYRAEFSKLEDSINMEWISWVDPKTKNPDYHVDSSFGEFRFLD